MKVYPVSQILFKENKKNNKSVCESKQKVINTVTTAGILGLSALAIVQGSKIKNLNQKLAKTAQRDTEIYAPQIRTKDKLLEFQVVKLENSELYKKFKDSGLEFIEFLKDVNAKPEEIKTLLFSITSDKSAADELVLEFMKNPRKNHYATTVITEKIGGENNFTHWLYSPKGYNDAYGDKLKELFKDTTVPVEDLIKISPDWHLHLLKKRSKNEEFVIGSLPKEFSHIEDFRNFTRWVMERGLFKDEEVIAEYSKVNVHIKPLTAGASGKYPFKIRFENSDKEFVLKVQATGGIDHEYVKDNLLVRPDTTYTNALLDYYLNAHNCENAIKFHYFDYKTGSALYDWQKGEFPKEIENVYEAKPRLKDLEDLGVFYNDFCPPNFKEDNGVLKIIDSGDSSFFDPLRPGAKGYTFELPNWCGIQHKFRIQ